MKRIAIDIDDTLNCTYNEGNIYALMMAYEYNHDFHFDKTKEDEVDRFQFPKDLKHEYLRRFFPLNVQSSSIKPYAIEVLNLLKKDFELFIMTSRKPDYDKPFQPYKGYMMVRDTKEWMHKNHVPIEDDHMIFGIKDKGEKCKDMCIDMLIDNSPKHIDECLRNNVKIIVMGYPYNIQYKEYSDNKRLMYLSSDDNMMQWKELYMMILHHNHLKTA